MMVELLGQRIGIADFAVDIGSVNAAVHCNMRRNRVGRDLKEAIYEGHFIT